MSSSLLTSRKRVVAIHKPNVSALPPGEKVLLTATIDRQLQDLLKEIKEIENLTIKEADYLSIKTANLIGKTALADEWEKKPKNQNTKHVPPEGYKQ